MDYFDTDLHIHSPHSIAVSKNLNLDTMVETCTKKGLSILGTGDITQPEWRKYLNSNLKKKNGVYSYKDTYFIIQTELEDEESVHHVILLPDIEAGEALQEKIRNKCKDVDGNYAGRPHVHASPAEIVEIVDDVGGISGPAHAFTPFKAIFRQKKFENLEQCYGSAMKKVYFLELGLSADTDLADHMSCLRDITFLSNSDAHSEGAQSLGREFNRMYIEEPSFDEIVMAIRRKNDRKITLNVGMEPRLGKYPMLFCKRCRRRISLSLNEKKNELPSGLIFESNLADNYAITNDFIYYLFDNDQLLQNFKSKIGKGKIKCVACQKEKKNSKIYLGVFDRIKEIGDYNEPVHPNHRPPYIGTVPLVEMIRVIKDVKSVKAKSVLNMYEKIIGNYGNEFKILTDESLTNQIEPKYPKLALLLKAFRNHEIDFVAGGGGKYGEIQIDAI